MEVGKIYQFGYVFTEISFNNVVYEFHCYSPYVFVAQDSSSDRLKYPQDNVIMPLDGIPISYVDLLWDAGQYNNGSSNTWQTLKNNTPEAVPTTGINNGYVLIYLKNLASNTTVTIDEIKVSEYDQSNNFIKDVFFDDFSSDFNYRFIDGSTVDDMRVQNSTNGGYSGDDAKIIQGATGSNACIMSNDYNNLFFVINPDYKYQISMRVKVQNPGSSTVVEPAIVYSYCEGQTVLNKSHIEASIQRYVDYSVQYNVPIFMGEYGISGWCFEKVKKISDGTYLNEGNLGGEQWIDDMLSVISDNKLSSSYWLYDCDRTNSWGMYAYTDPYNTGVKTYVNEYLENAFARYFGNSTEEPQVVSGEITIEPDTTNIVNELGITVNWPENIDGLTKQISMDGGNTFNPYTGKVTMATNGTVIARLLDSNNNVVKTASLVITNINSEATGFFHTSGKDIIDPTGETYTIKSINFVNDVWDYSGGIDYALASVTESDYQKMKSLGFNSVRFCLSHVFFQDNKGFQLIDQNIALAKKYGISLVLDMHKPTPDEDDDTVSDDFTLWTNESRQDDLIALWTSIADRYKNEPTIIGYDLVNEPEPVRYDSETTQQALDKWQNLASRISTGIRSVDSNHILFVEPILNVIDIHGNEDYSFSSRIFVYRDSF